MAVQRSFGLRGATGRRRWRGERRRCRGLRRRQQSRARRALGRRAIRRLLYTGWRSAIAGWCLVTTAALQHRRHGHRGRGWRRRVLLQPRTRGVVQRGAQCLRCVFAVAHACLDGCTLCSLRLLGLRGCDSKDGIHRCGRFELQGVGILR
ncbi:hypothetical protein OZ10_00635 [Xanthomonas cannabis pv. cannabis]|nr:hypothetical protein OZ10_00635 [Xanthomonas cannabis pv. cannabis]